MEGSPKKIAEEISEEISEVSGRISTSASKEFSDRNIGGA